MLDRDVRRRSRSGHDGHQLGFPGRPGWLRSTGSCHVAPDSRLTEKMVPASASGTDWRAMTPSRPGYDPARPSGGQRFTSTVTLTCDLFFELELTVEPPTSTGGKQVGLHRKIRSKSGRSKTWAETQV